VPLFTSSCLIAHSSMLPIRPPVGSTPWLYLRGARPLLGTELNPYERAPFLLHGAPSRLGKVADRPPDNQDMRKSNMT